MIASLPVAAASKLLYTASFQPMPILFQLLVERYF